MLLVSVVLAVALIGKVVVQVVMEPLERSDVNVVTIVEVFVVHDEVLLKILGALSCQSRSAVTRPLKASAQSSRSVPISGMAVAMVAMCEGVYQ